MIPNICFIPKNGKAFVYALLKSKYKYPVRNSAKLIAQRKVGQTGSSNSIPLHDSHHCNALHIYQIRIC